MDEIEKTPLVAAREDTSVSETDYVIRWSYRRKNGQIVRAKGKPFRIPIRARRKDPETVQLRLFPEDPPRIAAKVRTPKSARSSK